VASIKFEDVLFVKVNVNDEILESITSNFSDYSLFRFFKNKMFLKEVSCEDLVGALLDYDN
jgi:hypothetical protein